MSDTPCDAPRDGARAPAPDAPARRHVRSDLVFALVFWFVVAALAVTLSRLPPAHLFIYGLGGGFLYLYVAVAGTLSRRDIPPRLASFCLHLLAPLLAGAAWWLALAAIDPAAFRALARAARTSPDLAAALALGVCNGAAAALAVFTELRDRRTLFALPIIGAGCGSLAFHTSFGWGVAAWNASACAWLLLWALTWGRLRPEALHSCPACGYDLRGLEGNRCPECGTSSASHRSS